MGEGTKHVAPIPDKYPTLKALIELGWKGGDSSNRSKGGKRSEEKAHPGPRHGSTAGTPARRPRAYRIRRRHRPTTSTPRKDTSNSGGSTHNSVSTNTDPQPPPTGRADQKLVTKGTRKPRERGKGEGKRNNLEVQAHDYP